MSISREKYMSAEELNKLRAVCRDRATEDILKGRQGNVRLWMLIDLVTTSGLRVCELAKLNVGDYFGQSNRPYILVSSAKKRKVEKEPVPLSQDVVSHIEEYLRWRDLNGETLTPDAPLLTSERRKRYKIISLQKAFYKACANAGLKYSIHSARHTLGFHLLRTTKNLKLVQKQLRHASPVITANFYADVSFEEQQEAINGLFKAS